MSDKRSEAQLIKTEQMTAERIKLFPRLLIFWALHLALAAVGALALSLSGLVQSLISAEAGALTSLVAGVVVTGLYIFIFARVSRKVLRSRREVILTGLISPLPLLLTILGAVLYLQEVSYNTIGYSYILLPVMLPFIGWIEQVFPLLPYHILALTVPVALAGAIFASSFNLGNK